MLNSLFSSISFSSYIWGALLLSTHLFTLVSSCSADPFIIIKYPSFSLIISHIEVYFSSNESSHLSSLMVMLCVLLKMSPSLMTCADKFVGMISCYQISCLQGNSPGILNYYTGLPFYLFGGKMFLFITTGCQESHLWPEALKRAITAKIFLCSKIKLLSKILHLKQYTDSLEEMKDLMRLISFRILAVDWN